MVGYKCCTRTCRFSFYNNFTFHWLQAVAFLYLLKLLLARSLTMLLGVGKKLLGLFLKLSAAYSLWTFCFLFCSTCSFWLIIVINGLLIAGLVFAFTAFFVYEQYEAEIDEFAKFFFIGIMELKKLLASHLPTPLMSFLCCDRVPHHTTVSKR